MATMLITDQSLSRVSKRLLDKQVVDNSKFSVEGNISFINEKAFNFSSTSYIYNNSLSINSSQGISISCKSIFSVDEEAEQCLWSLSNSSTSLSLLFTSNNILLKKGSNILATIYSHTFKEGDIIDIELSLYQSTFSANIGINSNYFNISGNLSTSLSSIIFTSVNIGSNSYDRNNFWLGSIYLTNFSIRFLDKQVYSTSRPLSFKFTKLLISDGTIPLEDNSIPVLNHIFGFDITVIEQHNNVLLMKVIIDSSVHLNISEFGLYIKIENDKQLLFSHAKGFNIKKGSDLGYELLFIVNLVTQVVNTTGFPEIIVNKINPGNMNTFTEIKKTFLYLTTNLERAIQLNANYLGYAEELKLNSVQNDIDMWMKNFNASNTYYILKNNTYSENLKSIKDYYTLFSSFYSYYKTKNLSGLLDSDIIFSDNVITGDRDNINFSGNSALCLKLNLENSDNKLILCKTRIIENTLEKYFTLEFTDNSLIFKLFLEDDVVTLKATYFNSNIQSILSGPILLTVSCAFNNGLDLFMYINNTNVASAHTDSTNFLSSINYSLKNYIDDENEVDNLYVQNIISFNNTLYSNDILYLYKLLGLNS